MTDRVEVKTKAAAEKAIKAGLAINIIAGKFTLFLVDVNVSIWVSGTSAPRIVTRETSAPSIDANGYSSVFTRGDRLTGKGSANTIFRIQGTARIEGGNQFIIKLEASRDWCEYYGARIEGDNAVVYKAVGDDYMSAHGVRYAPGSMPEDKAWNGKRGECERGCGLNFSPTPRATHRFVPEPKHYLECRIALADMVVHFNGQYPEKCTAPRVVAPLIECDVDGNRVEMAETERADG